MNPSSEILSKTIANLQSALEQEKSEYLYDSVIRRFRFCVEHSCKLSNEVLNNKQTAPKIIIKKMGNSKLIDNINLWLKAVDQINLASHPYNEHNAKEYYRFIQSFFPEFKKLQFNLEKYKHQSKSF